jgi:hypothetical protein
MVSVPTAPHISEHPGEGAARDCVASLIHHADRCLRTGALGSKDFLAQLLGGVFLKQIEEIVVSDFKHFGGGRHAECIRLAEVIIDDHAHAFILASSPPFRFLRDAPKLRIGLEMRF